MVSHYIRGSDINIKLQLCKVNIPKLERSVMRSLRRSVNCFNAYTAEKIAI
jgi:hypothetical protein